LNPEAVILKLDVKLRTLTPPVVDAVTWDSQTPHNAAEVACQTELVKQRIARHQDSSPTPINEALDRLQKGVEMMAHSAVFLQSELSRLRTANEAATQRKNRKRKRIQERGSLTIQAGQDLISAAGAKQEVSGDKPQIGEPSDRNAAKRRRCGRCGKPGHNTRTCYEDIESTGESDASDS
jgi:hypothetical protein